MANEALSDVERYLANVVPAGARSALLHLRSIIREEAPEALETISYGVPTFKHHGMLASYAAFKSHCSFFPGSIVADFEGELAGFKTSKGTIQFTPERPLPDELVRAIIRARVAQNLAKKHK